MVLRKGLRIAGLFRVSSLEELDAFHDRNNEKSESDSDKVFGDAYGSKAECFRKEGNLTDERSREKRADTCDKECFIDRTEGERTSSL